MVMWASNRRFLADVAARNATPALFIEDDAELKPSFCEHTAAALRALRGEQEGEHDVSCN